MRTQKKTWKRILAFALVAMMVLSIMPLSVFAAESYTVTIIPDDTTDTSNPTRFSAYEIFTGTIKDSEYDTDPDGDPTKDTDEGNWPPAANKLSDPVWGSGVDAGDKGKIQALLSALMDDDTYLGKLGINASVIEQMAKLPAYETLFGTVKAVQDKYAEAEKYIADLAEYEKLPQEDKETTEKPTAPTDNKYLAPKNGSTDGEYEMAPDAETTYKADLKEKTDAILKEETGGITLGTVYAHSLKYNRYLTDAGNKASFSEDAELKWESSAAAIANVLSDLNKDAAKSNNNSDLALAFAKIIAEKLSTTKKSSAYGEGAKDIDTVKSEAIAAREVDPNLEADAKTALIDANAFTADELADAENADAQKAIEDMKTALVEKAGEDAEYDYRMKYGWTISGLGGGYYLIKDETTKAAKDEAISEYMVAVFGNQKIKMKADSVKVDKWILAANGETPKVTNTEIGKRVTFVLKGELPDNYASYDEYYFEFYDTMTEGLTYIGGGSEAESGLDNVLNVYVEMGANSTEKYMFQLNAGNSNTDAKGYYIAQSGTTLQVIFNDLTQVELYTIASTDQDTGKMTAGARAQKPGDDGVTPVYIKIDKTAKIYVQYVAEVNKDAAITASGNVNKVTIKYSNDPHNNKSGRGETTEKKAFVYSFGVNITKVDESGKELDNVEFMLYRKNDGVNYYAVVDGGKLLGWLEEKTKDGSDELDYEAMFNTITEEDMPDLYAYVEDGTITADKLEGLMTLVTANGGQLKIDGFEANNATYYLKETKPAEGYDTIKDIEITFKAEFYPTEEASNLAFSETGLVKNLSMTYTKEIGDPGKVEIVKNGKYVGTGDAATMPLVAGFNVINYEAGRLPSTGGSGTTMYYIVGGMMILAAVAFLFFQNKKKVSTR